MTTVDIASTDPLAPWEADTVQTVLLHAAQIGGREPARMAMIVVDPSGEAAFAKSFLLTGDHRDKPIPLEVRGAVAIDAVRFSYYNDSKGGDVLIEKVRFNDQDFTPHDDAIVTSSPRKQYENTSYEAHTSGLMRYNSTLEFSDTEWRYVDVYVAGETLGLAGTQFDLSINGELVERFVPVRVAAPGLLDPATRADAAELFRCKRSPDAVIETITIGFTDLFYRKPSIELPDGRDQNLYVDRIEIGDAVYRPGPDATFRGGPDRPLWQLADDEGYIRSAGALTFEIGETPPPDPRIVPLDEIPEPPEGMQTVLVFATGGGQRELSRMGVLVNGELVGKAVVGPEDGATPFVFFVGADVDIETVTTRFLNDGDDPGRDLTVHKVVFGGETYFPETDAVVTRSARSERENTSYTAQAEGFLQYNADLEFSDTDWRFIDVYVAGEGLGVPERLETEFDIAINGELVERHVRVSIDAPGRLDRNKVSESADRFRFKVAPETAIETIAIIYDDDRYSRPNELAAYHPGFDTNLYVNRVEIGDDVFLPGYASFDSFGESLHGSSTWAGYITVNGVLTFDIGEDAIL